MPKPANSFSALEAVGDEEICPSTSAPAESVGDDCSISSQEGRKDGNTGVRKGKRLRNPLVWIDLEMTGLDVERDTIIEVACIITDGDLNNEMQGPCTAIHAPDEVLDAMNEWCREHHGASGLTQRVRESSTSMLQAEEALLAFVREHTEEGMAQLAGNSVHVDRMFLLRHMPRLVAHLSYRIVDVSSIKELARRWFPAAYKRAPRKACAHTALADIRESMAELRYYRKAVFKSPNQCK